MKIRRDLVDYIYFGLFGIFLILFITGQFTSVTGTQLVVIDNADPNSMFPTYFQGDLFVIQKNVPTDIHLGDVLVYENNNRDRIIHRVIDIESSNGEYYFRVKGDNPVTNFEPDDHDGGHFIPFEDVLGKVIYRLPYLGHISLAIQQNPAVQMLTILTVLALAIAILFLPDEEEDDEPTHYELSKQAFENMMMKLKAKIRSLFGIFTTSRYKVLAWSLFVTLILITFIPYFFPLFLPLSDGQQRGVQSVQMDYTSTLVENPGLESSKFYNVFVTLYDDGPLFNHIEGYTLEVLYNSEVVDTTIWNTMRPIKGEFTVGGSITLDTSFINTISDGTELTIQIIVDVDELFGSSQLEAYTTTFVYSSS